MIDCLSNPEWINPQIDFLLLLQNFRIGHLEILDKFFLSVTVFGEFWLPAAICAITYWCIDFKTGMYLFSLHGMNILLTHFFKMLACVYRPWILSSDMHPSELAVPYAKGYSFPSGHSAMSSSVIGGLAYIFRKKRFLCIFCIGLVLLVGFSRLWLGVHTPQDVVCGFLIGLVLVFGLNYLYNRAEKDRNRYLYILGIINTAAAAALIYICYFNQYRIDYVSGEMLVNPADMVYHACVVYGYALGILNGCFLCRRFYPFDPQNKSVKCRIIRGFIGTLWLILMIKFLFRYVILNTLAIKIAMPIVFLAGLSLTLIYPIIFINSEKYLKLK